MVDLHVHILPGIDDGSQSLEESLFMAHMAADSGVHAMAVTPHCNIPGVFDNYDSSVFRQRFSALKKAVQEAKIDLQLFPGMEVFLTENIGELIRSKKLVGINDGAYLLSEFSFEQSAEWMTFLLEEVLEAGMIPLVAHPERYAAVIDHPQVAYEWVRMGCALQVNKGSILGRFGKPQQKTAFRLLDHELVACIASDAHHAQFRSPHMEEAAGCLEHYYGSECIELLLKDNPRRILNSRDIILLEPRGFSEGWFA